MVRIFLMLLFASFLLAMLAGTVWASLDRAVWNAGPELTGDRWFLATLLDAYLGFLTFYAWVAYKESTWRARLAWFVLIMSLGNMAMAAYVLLQLGRLPAGVPTWILLLRPPHAARVNP